MKPHFNRIACQLNIQAEASVQSMEAGRTTAPAPHLQLFTVSVNGPNTQAPVSNALPQEPQNSKEQTITQNFTLIICALVLNMKIKIVAKFVHKFNQNLFNNSIF